MDDGGTEENDALTKVKYEDIPEERREKWANHLANFVGLFVDVDKKVVYLPPNRKHFCNEVPECTQGDSRIVRCYRDYTYALDSLEAYYPVLFIDCVHIKIQRKRSVDTDAWRFLVSRHYYFSFPSMQVTRGSP